MPREARRCLRYSIYMRLARLDSVSPSVNSLRTSISVHFAPVYTLTGFGALSPRYCSKPDLTASGIFPTLAITLLLTLLCFGGKASSTPRTRKNLVGGQPAGVRNSPLTTRFHVFHGRGPPGSGEPFEPSSPVRRWCSSEPVPPVGLSDSVPPPTVPCRQTLCAFSNKPHPHGPIRPTRAHSWDLPCLAAALEPPADAVPDRSPPHH